MSVTLNCSQATSKCNGSSSTATMSSGSKKCRNGGMELPPPRPKINTRLMAPSAAIKAGNHNKSQTLPVTMRVALNSECCTPLAYKRMSSSNWRTSYATPSCQALQTTVISCSQANSSSCQGFAPKLHWPDNKGQIPRQSVLPLRL